MLNQIKRNINLALRINQGECVKKAVILFLLVLLGIGFYKGRAVYERFKIDMSLKMMPTDLSWCEKGEVSPEFAPVRNQVCSLERELNEQIKVAADSSKTHEEFRQKAEAILIENSEKIRKILDSYKETTSQQEEVAQ